MIRQDDPASATVTGLLHRLVDNGRDYVRAEVDVVRETARARFASAKVAIAVLVAAIFVVQAGLTVLFMAIGSGLAHWLGVGGGQAVAALIAFVIAGIMVKYAVSHFSPAETASVAGDRS